MLTRKSGRRGWWSLNCWQNIGTVLMNCGKCVVARWWNASQYLHGHRTVFLLPQTGRGRGGQLASSYGEHIAKLKSQLELGLTLTSILYYPTPTSTSFSCNYNLSLTQLSPNLFLFVIYPSHGFPLSIKQGVCSWPNIRGWTIKRDHDLLAFLLSSCNALSECLHHRHDGILIW